VEAFCDGFIKEHQRPPCKPRSDEDPEKDTACVDEPAPPECPAGELREVLSPASSPWLEVKLLEARPDGTYASGSCNLLVRTAAGWFAAQDISECSGAPGEAGRASRRTEIEGSRVGQILPGGAPELAVLLRSVSSEVEGSRVTDKTARTSLFICRLEPVPSCTSGVVLREGPTPGAPPLRLRVPTGGGLVVEEPGSPGSIFDLGKTGEKKAP